MSTFRLLSSAGPLILFVILQIQEKRLPLRHIVDKVDCPDHLTISPSTAPIPLTAGPFIEPQTPEDDPERAASLSSFYLGPQLPTLSRLACRPVHRKLLLARRHKRERILERIRPVLLPAVSQ
jgi:hypothetical protein